MKRFTVNWKHILGGANVEYVKADSPEKAIAKIEMRQGSANLVFVRVINY